MKSLFLLVALLSSLLLQAQDTVLLSLEKIAFTMLNDQDETKRLASQDQVSHLLDSILQSPDSWNRSFEGIKSIAILTSPDQHFRIFNWNVPFNDGTFKFYGLIQIKGNRKNSYQVIRLTDYSNELTKASSKSLSENQWFGALYYSILEKKYKKKVYYVLLGWDGNSAFSNKKLIDVLQIGADNSISFGAPIFDDGKRLRHRVFFEHSERCTMSLRYQEKNDWIVFDHLAPTQPSLTGQYEFYGPDFTFDAFKWEKGRFKFYSDVDVRNEGKNEGKQTKKPERGLQPEGLK